MKLSPKTNSQISEKVRNWYEFSRDVIPTLGSRSFLPFIAGSSSLSLQVTDKAARYRFIIDPKSPSAYIDREHGTIALPIWYVDHKTLAEMFGEEADLEAVSLSLCNGSHIHEALHAEHTNLVKIDSFYELLSPSDKAFMLANSEVASTIMNVVEDLFIESVAKSQLDSELYDMIVAKNDLLFLDEEVKDMLMKASSASTPAEIATFQVKLFTTLKNVHTRRLVERSSVMASIFARVKNPDDEFEGEKSGSRPFHTARERAEYACKVTYAILHGLSEADRAKVGGSDDGDGKKGTPAGGDSKFMVNGEKSPETEGIEMELSEKEIEAIKSQFEAATQSALMVAKIKQAREDDMNTSTFRGLPSVEYYDDIFALRLPVGRFTLRTSETNYSFVNLLRQLRTKNHTTGPVRQSGSHLVNQRLYRIGTDGKMFNNKQFETEGANKVAVVILVDASGSMGSMYADVITDALAMFKALRDNNIPTAVYAHTSAVGELNTPGLYRIIDCGITRNDTQTDERFNTALGIHLAENYDGAIIEALTHRVFANLPAATKKLLFVLSDGSPSGGGGYSGSSATLHTQNAIKAARKLGIFVAAISLVSSVVYANEKIYGAEYNVNASSNIRKSFENLVIRMQEEGRL